MHKFITNIIQRRLEIRLSTSTCQSRTDCTSRAPTLRSNKSWLRTGIDRTWALAGPSTAHLPWTRCRASSHHCNVTKISIEPCSRKSFKNQFFLPQITGAFEGLRNFTLLNDEQLQHSVIDASGDECLETNSTLVNVLEYALGLTTILGTYSCRDCQWQFVSVSGITPPCKRGSEHNLRGFGQIFRIGLNIR